MWLGFVVQNLEFKMWFFWSLNSNSLGIKLCDLVDESVISVFYIIFEFILFRFYMFLFPFYSYFTSIASYFISVTNISKIASWSKRKVIWILFVPKIWRSYTKIYWAKSLKILHQNMKPGAPLIVLLLLLLLRRAAYFSISDREPIVSCATL